jgi:transaldolase
MGKTTLHKLYEDYGQSPWLDNLRRDYLTGGHLAELIAQGVRGITTNPTIMANSIEDEEDYDEQLCEMAADLSAEDAYWELSISDVRDALGFFKEIYESSKGDDGFVSIEVSPRLAHDRDATIAAARHLHERIGEPNLLVKVPATKEGIPAIRTLISEGHSINVTLIFSIERYGEVIDAYLGGLEDLLQAGNIQALKKVRSVASFFVSRIDTEVDRRLDALAEAGTSVEHLKGRIALAQAKTAYALFLEKFSGPRWEKLKAAGGALQKPLWASTSTKNPAYPDLLYVDGLIGPSTVNTMPDATLAAFLDHGTLRRTVDEDLEQAKKELEELAQLGIDMTEVTNLLEEQGVASFEKSFDGLMTNLEAKLASLRGRRGS